LIPVWKLNAAQVFCLACLGVVMGNWLKRRLPLLDRLNIPAPIAGGMVYALLELGLRDRYLNFEADVMLRDLLMVTFMTTVGLNARLRLIREGGLGVVWLLAIASAGAAIQNLLGIGLALALHVDPRLGILTGSVALAGGPATALAFGPVFEKMGVQGSTAAAFAAATFGITVAGLIAGYIGGSLVRRHKLTNASHRAATVRERPETHGPGSSAQLLPAILVMGVPIGLGSLLSDFISRHGIILPSYIGAMIVAAVIRNLDDRYHFARLREPDVTAIGRMVLNLFIVMALLTLRLWELAHLALPMLVMLASQVALCWLACRTVVFRIMGRDYDAAVTSAGFCGFMLGITSNAMASMEVLVEKFGDAPRAFLVVPVVGAFLIDFTNSLIITAMANWRWLSR
jgi:ESS family glutamate:Na+ symporter